MTLRLKVALHRLALDYSSKLKNQKDYKKELASNFKFFCFVVLTQQSTDERAFQSALKLFKELPTAKDILQADIDQISELIKSSGLQQKKAQAIQEIATYVVNHHGEIPKTREELESFSLVGRKTASLVLHECFGVASFPVDTHIKRVISRISKFYRTSKQVEALITNYFLEDEWFYYHNVLRVHGQTLCTAKTPKCQGCPVNMICCFYETERRITNG